MVTTEPRNVATSGAWNAANECASHQSRGSPLVPTDPMLAPLSIVQRGSLSTAMAPALAPAGLVFYAPDEASQAKLIHHWMRPAPRRLQPLKPWLSHIETSSIRCPTIYSWLAVLCSTY